MKRFSFVFLLIAALLVNVFAAEMIIEKTDGSTITIAIDEINQITFGEDAPEIPSRVLFIGNSYTYFNGGLNVHVQELVSSAHPEWDFVADNITAGGATLEMHYNNDSTLESISSGNWDMVILQEQSTRPVEEPEMMYQFATLLDGVITEAGAETGFFMTWARANDPDMIEGLATAYNTIGEQLDALVTPVGRAFQLSLESNPLLGLHVSDNSHPSQEGTYLAACTFYAFLFNESPVGIEYNSSDEITETEKVYLQGIAWQTYQNLAN